MPNRDIHNLICEIAGIDLKKANYVNKMMDLPSQVYGSQHRKLFHGQHSNKVKTPIGTIQVNRFQITNKDIIELMALTNFDTEKIKAWILHLMADGVAKDSITYYPKGTKHKKHRKIKKV
jgi:hypothetical protein